MRHRALGALAVGLIAFGGLLLLVSDDAAAVGEQVEITPGNRSVLEGRSSTIRVFFSPGDQTETVHVTCEDDVFPEPSDECPIWTTEVRYNPNRDDCAPEEGRRVCDVDFPGVFGPNQEGGPSPTNVGEPSRLGTYLVSVEDEGQQQDQDTFEVHLSTAFTCRNGLHRRGEQMLITSSGHEQGDTIELEVVDLERGRTLVEETRQSAGRFVAYDFLWHPPLDYDLGSDAERRIEVRIDSPTKSEQQTLRLERGVAFPIHLLAPGFRDQDLDYNRTESALWAVRYVFPGRAPGCNEVPFADPTPVGPDRLRTDQLRANVYKIESVPGLDQQTRNFTDATFARFIPSANAFLFNYTIPKDAEASRNNSGEFNPVYDLQIPRTTLDDENALRETNTSDFRVHPYTIVPEFLELQEEVERLETAEVLVNLTYADGSGFTPNDTNEPVEIEFGPVDGQPRFNVTLEHQRGGRWNASVELGFEYEPLGDYVWRVEETHDDHGQRPGRNNEIVEKVSDIVEVVGARPLLDLDTFVGDEEVNGTERTRTVHATLHAEYKNGLQLTAENVDPSLGGVQLRVKKTNEFGRVLSVDSLVMTPADDAGNWVRSFRVGRTESSAPIGEWELEVVARDNSDPPNENVTGFPFDVRPAQLQVSPLREPPALIDDEEQLEYRIRLTYPDGTLLTERLVDPARGGDLTVRLERVRGVGLDPAVEQVFTPRSLSAGQAWRVTIDPSKLVPGNHFFNVTGEDIHGNQIGPTSSRLFTVLFNGEFRNSTTPICSELGANETCDRERGSEIFAIFPGSEGDKGLQGEAPEIRVLRKVPGQARWLTHKQDIRISNAEFENLTGKSVEEAHIGRFQTDESTPEGRYRLYIIGRAEDDTGFAGYSQAFNITAITVDREIVRPLPDTAEKLDTLTATIERQRGDVVDSAFAQSGRVRSRAVQVTPTGLGTFVQWTPPKTTPTGPATIEIEGRDVFGNPFEATLGPVQLRPLDISVDIAVSPEQEAPRGRIMETQAEMTYPDGSTFRPALGRPEVRILDARGEQVGEGSSLFAQGRWELNWRPPARLPEGRYVMEITGRDDAGNVIETVQTRPFEVVPGLIPGRVENPPNDIPRGSVANARFSFDTDITDVNATVTTGTEVVGDASAQVNNGTVRLSFPTDRRTPLVQAFFQITGRDAHGNELTAESPSFQIDPMRLTVRFTRPPPVEIPREGTVNARFVIEYPDGTRLRAGQGSPIVGLFLRDQPRGLVEEVQPLNQDPTVWRIRWTPPEDVVTDVPFHFTVSGLDQWQNEAPPTSSRGFFVTNPVVPDYLPTPGPGSWVALAALLGATGLAAARRRRP